MIARAQYALGVRDMAEAADRNTLELEVGIKQKTDELLHNFRSFASAARTTHTA